MENKEKHKIYYRKNKERILRVLSEWRKNNTEFKKKRSSYFKEWCKKNPDKMKQYKLKYKMLKKEKASIINSSIGDIKEQKFIEKITKKILKILNGE